MPLLPFRSARARIHPDGAILPRRAGGAGTSACVRACFRTCAAKGAAGLKWGPADLTRKVWIDVRDRRALAAVVELRVRSGRESARASTMAECVLSCVVSSGAGLLASDRHALWPKMAFGLGLST